MIAHAPTQVIPSEEIIQYIHPSLLHVDYTSSSVQLFIILLTFVFFVLQFFLTLSIVNFFKAFAYLHMKHRAFLALAVSRAIYGLTCMVFGGYSLLKHTNLDRDVVFGTTATAHLAMVYTVGFFFFELSAVIVSDVVFKSFSKLLLVHHSLALLSFSLAVGYCATYSFGLRGLMLEMSTPFSCLCFVMLKCKKENSLAWKINQLLLVHTFHLRSVVEFYLLYVTYCNWNLVWDAMPLPIFFMLYLSLCTNAFFLTPYWGYKKTQQLFNPVDWNFQERRSEATVLNGEARKTV